ncbi:MAG: FkbM family methyltransferase [Candidatus Hodarchaeales archaeon]|jgi:FkbM family methyltransferase
MDKELLVYIDIGAKDGLAYWEKDFGLGKPNVIVYAFEANPDVFKRLKRHEKTYNNLHVYQQAVSLKNGVATFYITQNPECCTLLTPLNEITNQNEEIPRDSLKVVKKVIVETITLKRFMENENIKSVEFLKIDTEGNDLNVVKSAAEYIKRVKNIKLEVQSGPEYYVGSSGEKETVEYLSSFEFSLIGKYDHPHGWAHDLTFRNLHKD